MLIQRSGLAKILEVRCKLGHAVSQLVSNDIQGFCEADKNLVIAVTKGHFVSITERIHIIFAEVNV